MRGCRGSRVTQNAPAACLGFVSGGCAAVNTPATGGAGLLALHVELLPGKEVAGAAAAAGAGTPIGRSKHRGLDSVPPNDSCCSFAAASDLWALGCVLFECASGRPPFAAGTTQQLNASILHHTPQLPPGAALCCCTLPLFIWSAGCTLVLSCRVCLLMCVWSAGLDWSLPCTKQQQSPLPCSAAYRRYLRQLSSSCVVLWERRMPAGYAR